MEALLEKIRKIRSPDRGREDRRREECRDIGQGAAGQKAARRAHARAKGIFALHAGQLAQEAIAGDMQEIRDTPVSVQAAKVHHRNGDRK